MTVNHPLFKNFRLRNSSVTRARAQQGEATGTISPLTATATCLGMVFLSSKTAHPKTSTGTSSRSDSMWMYESVIPSKCPQEQGNHIILSSCFRSTHGARPSSPSYFGLLDFAACIFLAYCLAVSITVRKLLPWGCQPTSWRFFRFGSIHTSRKQLSGPTLYPRGLSRCNSLFLPSFILLHYLTQTVQENHNTQLPF